MNDLQAMHERAGARMVEIAPGVVAPRNYGDPAAEYAAAQNGAIVVDRPDRLVLRVHGRDPVRMLHGLVTNDVAGTAEGGSVYAAMLTPKGRMIADLRVIRRPGAELLLVVDAGARQAVVDHLRKSVPPLFAKQEDAGDRWAVLTLIGPSAASLLENVLDGFSPPEASEPLAREVASTAQFQGDEVIAVLAGGDGGWEILAAPATLPALWHAIAAAGATPAGHATLEVLRIEAGRPRWGAELDVDVIPLEAGLRHKAISETKGCYTGQEVIIRILHRGHVNRHLRGLLLGDTTAPAPGTSLVRAEDGRSLGKLTSACFSPRMGQTVALGYLRREVEPGSTVRLDTVDGHEARVVELPFSPAAD